MALRDDIESFFITKAADGYSPTTLEMYRWALGLMLEHLGDVEIDTIDKQDLRRFFIWLQDEYVPTRPGGNRAPLTGRSRENIWTAMRSFFRWAREEGITTVEPDQAIKRPRYTKKEIEPFTMDEIEAMLKACESMRKAQTNNRKAFTMKRPSAARDKAILITLFDTGIRASELCRLKVGDVNLEDAEIKIRAFGTGRKTKARTIQISAPTLKALWRYLHQRKTHPEDPLFLTREGYELDRMGVLRLVKTIGDRAGVKNAHPHRFRHSFAIFFLRNGGNVFELQRLLGHSTLEMVQNYLKLAQSDLENAHRRASPAARLKI